MEILRTPDEYFTDLDGYRFSPNYINVQAEETPALRMHYLDEGKADGEIILLLHGQPTWSYLYRKMIPVLVSGGFRVIAPDLIGFGKSDKPADTGDYTYARHTTWLVDFIQKLKLNNVNVFMQDWGGLLGLRIAGYHEHFFSRIFAANTGLPVGGMQMPEEWLFFKKLCASAKKLPIGRILKSGCVSDLSDSVLAGYRAPFLDEKHQSGAKIFPSLIPLEVENPEALVNRKAWENLRNWKKPFLTLFSDSDPITRRGDLFFRRMIPGTKNMPHQTIVGAGHFLQEDKGVQLAEIICDFIKSAYR